MLRVLCAWLWFVIAVMPAGPAPTRKIATLWAGLWSGFFLMYCLLCAPLKLSSPLLARLWCRYWMPVWSIATAAETFRTCISSSVLFNGPDDPQNCCVTFSFSKRLAGKKSPKWPILCLVWRTTLTQSVNQSDRHTDMFDIHISRPQLMYCMHVLVLKVDHTFTLLAVLFVLISVVVVVNECGCCQADVSWCCGLWSLTTTAKSSSRQFPSARSSQSLS